MRIVLSVMFLALGAAGASQSVWDGVYTSEQASRGETLYLAECARCHGENLLGGEDTSGPLVGDEYLQSLNGTTVGDLVELIRLTMPTDGAGYLTRRRSTDLAAYLLSTNKYPAGDAELSSTLRRLNEIEFRPKP